MRAVLLRDGAPVPPEIDRPRAVEGHHEELGRSLERRRVRRGGRARRLARVAAPTSRNSSAAPKRYPERKRAFESGGTVFLPDAATDPMLRSIKSTLDMRNVRSIVVVPIRWEGSVIGAIFLRTERDAEPFSPQNPSREPFLAVQETRGAEFSVRTDCAP